VLSVSTAAPKPLFFCLITIAVLAALVFKGKDAIFTKPLRSLTSAHLVPAVLICACIGFNFYDAWFDSGIIARIASLIGLPGRFIALLLAAFGAMAAIPAAAILIADYSEIVIDGYRKSPYAPGKGIKGLSMRKSFILLSVVFLIGISVILRANFNYIDDMGRVSEGYLGWGNFSRFTSNGIAAVFHMDTYLTDISPLTQLIAVLILALTGVLLLYVVYERKSYSIWELVALIPLGLNPYFLECIS